MPEQSDYDYTEPAAYALQIQVNPGRPSAYWKFDDETEPSGDLEEVRGNLMAALVEGYEDSDLRVVAVTVVPVCRGASGPPTCTGEPHTCTPDAATEAHEKGYEAGYAQACDDFGQTSAAIARQSLLNAADEVTEDGGPGEVLALYIDEARHDLDDVLDGIRRWLRERADRIEPADSNDERVSGVQVARSTVLKIDRGDHLAGCKWTPTGWICNEDCPEADHA